MKVKRLLIPRPPELPALVLEQARNAAAKYAKGSRAASTWRAYESDWKSFGAWCQSVHRPSLPAEPSTVALFLAAQAKLGIAPSTLGRRLAAIRLMHVGAKLSSPHDALEVDEVMRGIRRAWKRPVAQKAPAVDEEIKQMVDAVEPQTLKGLRDRALLLLGFAGAIRRSELVALDTQHLHERPEGLAVLIASSKTDQEGHGQVVAIPRVPGSPYCPVQAVSDWLVASDTNSGAVFRSMKRGDKVGRSRLTAQSVALIIKRLATKVGLDPSRYAGHSLRSGFLTSAARNRASIFKMADQSRHKSLDVLREYVRNEERFDDHASEGLLRSALGRRSS
jgi:site-specific recombinase XerD